MNSHDAGTTLGVIRREGSELYITPLALTKVPTMRSTLTLGLFAVLCVCLCAVCHDIPETPSALLGAMQQQVPAHSRARYNAELARASQRQKRQYEEAAANAGDADPATYDVRFMNMTLDHFNFFTSPRNFSLRYLWDDSNWGSHSIPGTDCKGPIFFYTGNEGDITLYVQGVRGISISFGHARTDDAA